LLPLSERSFFMGPSEFSLREPPSPPPLQYLSPLPWLSPGMYCNPLTKCSSGFPSRAVSPVVLSLPARSPSPPLFLPRKGKRSSRFGSVMVEAMAFPVGLVAESPFLRFLLPFESGSVSEFDSATSESFPRISSMRVFSSRCVFLLRTPPFNKDGVGVPKDQTPSPRAYSSGFLVLSFPATFSSPL